MTGLFSGKLDKALERGSVLALLPKYTRAYNSKDEFTEKYTYEESRKVVDTAKFIRFNTVKFTKSLIFDVDNFPSFGFKPTLQQMHDHFYNLTGFEPTYTLETSKGYHIALVLDNGIFTTRKDNITVTENYRALLKLKKEITKLIDADENGSHRTHGIWRNPLTHEKIMTHKKYNFSDLLNEFDIEVKKIKPKISQGQLIANDKKLTMNKDNKIISTIEKGFFVGNRNNYIFAYGYKKLFEDRSLSSTNLEQIMLDKNNQYTSPLRPNEVIAIASSIIKLKDTMYQSNKMYVRGRLSDEMWKKNIHGISKRRAYSGWKIAKERAEKTLTKITECLLDNFSKGKMISDAEVATTIDKSKRTVQRYQDKFNLKAIIFTLWTKKQAKLMASAKTTQKIDIRPFVVKDIVKELQSLFSPFIASDIVLLQDRERKREYLRGIYPLTA